MYLLHIGYWLLGSRTLRFCVIENFHIFDLISYFIARILLNISLFRFRFDYINPDRYMQRFNSYIPIFLHVHNIGLLF